MYNVFTIVFRIKNQSRLLLCMLNSHTYSTLKLQTKGNIHMSSIVHVKQSQIQYVLLIKLQTKGNICTRLLHLYTLQNCVSNPLCHKLKTLTYMYVQLILLLATYISIIVIIVIFTVNIIIINIINIFIIFIIIIIIIIIILHAKRSHVPWN